MYKPPDVAGPHYDLAVTIGHRTNAIYQEVIAWALDLEIDAVTHAGQRCLDRRLVRTFGGDVAVVRELRRLREFNAAARHVDIGAYHYALLFSVLPDSIEAINEAHAGGEPMQFCGGRFVVRRIDVEMFVGQFFEDTDFELPKDVVNELGAAGTAALGLDDAVFGVVNALAPHAEELEPRRGRADAVVEIVELTAADEARLRRRHEADPEGVCDKIAAMGALYRPGETFPWWPPWLDGA